MEDRLERLKALERRYFEAVDKAAGSVKWGAPVYGAYAAFLEAATLAADGGAEAFALTREHAECVREGVVDRFLNSYIGLALQSLFIYYKSHECQKVSNTSVILDLLDPKGRKAVGDA
jgi:hypothetical protein